MYGVVNSWAVLAAAATALIVGAVWYSKLVFGETWAQLAKLSDRRLHQGATMAILQAFAAALIMAFALAQFIRVVHANLGQDYLVDALTTAAWVWLGFSATTLIIHNSFEQKRKKLTLLAMGYQFVTIMLMGAVIGLLN